VVRPGQPIGLPVNRRIPFGRIRNSSPPVGVWGVRRMGRVERNLGCRCPTRGRASGGVCWWIGPGSPTWSKGWLALSAVVAPRCAARECPDLPLCDVSRPSMTCPFGMVLGAVVAVAQQVCHDRRGYLGDEVPQRGVADHQSPPRNRHPPRHTYTHAAKYPDAIALAAGILNTTGFPRSSDTSPQKANRPAQRT
jgi:hypothetical protein